MSARLRFELLFALAWIAFGALVLPALVYAVGTVLLGAYTSGGLPAFYANLYRDAISGAWAALSLIFGPYVVLMIARLPLLARRGRERSRDDSDTSEPRSGRIEPRIGS